MYVKSYAEAPGGEARPDAGDFTHKLPARYYPLELPSINQNVKFTKYNHINLVSIKLSAFEKLVIRV